METKELKITPPEGYEIDKENSTFECIKFKPKKLTYKDVAKALFSDKAFYLLDYGDLITNYNGSSLLYTTNSTAATSKKQLEKLLAINKLMNVAKYLNDNWKPDWNDTEYKYYPYLNNDNIIATGITTNKCIGIVHFMRPTYIKQTINILGEETIRLALSTDW